MSEIDLRWQLRQLPREIEPPRDLWPGIAARIQPRRAGHSRRWLAGLALAASLLLAVGLAWRLQRPASAPAEDGEAVIVAAQARAINDEYEAALRQFDGAPMAPEYNDSLRSLDHSLVEIHRAIAADPGSVFLLEQLQKTYSHRLALTQRAVTG